jgi:hypothetical protein
MSQPFNAPYQFGEMVGAHHVDAALIDIIDYWGPTYLYETARRSGEEANELRYFRSKRVSHELEKMPEDQTPALILVNLGIQDEPSKIGTARPGKTYYATWRYQFGVLLSARGKKVNAVPRAQELAKMYCLAIRTLIIQKRDDPDVNPTWKGILGMTDWIDEGYGGLDSEDDRTICLAHTDFNVNVPSAATWATGPLEVEEMPEPDSPIWPEVVSVDVDVQKVEGEP